MGYPIVPGHEISGTVHSMGSEALSAGRVSVGDRVMAYPWMGCLSDGCTVCAAGDRPLCPSSSKELGFGVDGGYAEYVTVPHYRFVLKLPDNISFSLGALLPCSGVTAYSAIQKCLPTAQKVRKWEKGLVAAVIGLGGLGQWCLKLLPHCLGKEGLVVIGFDVNARKIEQAKESGLLDEGFVFSLQAPIEEQVEKFTHDLSNKPNIIIDFVNSTATFSLCVQLLQRLGVHVMVGLHGGLGELKLPLAVLSGCTHVGCLVGTLEELQELMELVRREDISVAVKRYQLSEAEQALKDTESGLLDRRAVLDMQAS